MLAISLHVMGGLCMQNMNQQTADLISGLERAVSYVDRARDKVLYDLLDSLRNANKEKDGISMEKFTHEIVNHAMYRYAAVVEQAELLLRHITREGKSG
jgi:hypothetical protein